MSKVCNDKKQNVIKNYKVHFELSQRYIAMSINSNDWHKMLTAQQKAIEQLEQLVSALDVTDYLLIDSNPLVPKNVYCEAYFNLGTLYKTVVENLTNQQMKELQKNALDRGDVKLSDEHQKMMMRSIQCFQMILRVKFADVDSIKQLVSVYTRLCFFVQENLDMCLKYMQEALLFSPDDEHVHYNLGHIYQRLNKPELALIHYKISLEFSKREFKDYKHLSKEEKRQLQLNNLNGISGIFRSIKQWPEALFYLQLAEKIDAHDPDIQNQLGIVLTEMRRTDLAEKAYTKAVKNYKRTFISTDSELLLAESYLNFGHMHAYNGDNDKAIEFYNKSLKINPKFALPFQNKLMNLSYLFDDLQDKMYITEQHKKINKLYNKTKAVYRFDRKYFECDKINIGIISGDFVDHPVSFFISTFLKNFDSSIFNVTCFSECLIDTSLFNNNLRFKFIRSMSAEQVGSLIYSEKVHILFDLSGHTAFNRLDVFALKPAPVQLTYVGYPFSTGLNEMDYRITDAICDHKDISQPFYTETLLFLPNCFLCYDPTVIKRLPNGDIFQFHHPKLNSQPFLKNNYITIGCFNRVNKITTNVIKYFNDILMKHANVRFVFKTKALLNKNISKTFLDKFDQNVTDRIQIIDCTIHHEDHLLEYNNVDIAIDTFPYSGTTTSCEALFMGVPVFTLYDSEYYFHPQNVTASILKNSHDDLSFFILSSKDDVHVKLQSLQQREPSYWEQLKPTTRKQFLEGNVCNKNRYMRNMNETLLNIYKSEIDKY